MSLSTVDLVTPFDPTGYTSISGAQLEQLVAGAYPNTDHGMIIVTTDIAGVPEVPDARTGNGNEKWQKYLWIRQSATGISAYVWDTTAAVLTPLYAWVSINVAGIGNKSITTDKIGDSAVGTLQVSSIDGSKITGTLNPTVSANFVTKAETISVGDLAGTSSTYGNVVIADNAITVTKIKDGAITTDKIVDKTIPLSKITSSGSAGQMPVVQTSDTTIVEWQTPKIITRLADPGSGNIGQVIRVNSGYNGFEYVTFPSAVIPGETRNLIIKYASATTMTATVDSVSLVDSSNIPMITGVISATLNIGANAGLNKLDTGTVGNGNWYYIWAISDGTAPGMVFSLSTDFATVMANINTSLPTYLYAALIGSVYYVSNSLVIQCQMGRTIYIPSTTLITAATAANANTYQSYISGGTTALSITVPPMAKTLKGQIGNVTAPLSNRIAGSSTGIGEVIHNPTSEMTLFEIPLITAQTLFWQAGNNTQAYNVILANGYTI